MKASAAIAALVVVGIFSFSAWTLARKWNYSFGYESLVRGTVCEMVKPEYIQEGQCDD